MGVEITATGVGKEVSLAPIQEVIEWYRPVSWFWYKCPCSEDKNPNVHPMILSLLIDWICLCAHQKQFFHSTNVWQRCTYQLQLELHYYSLKEPPGCHYLIFFWCWSMHGLHWLIFGERWLNEGSLHVHGLWENRRQFVLNSIALHWKILPSFIRYSSFDEGWSCANYTSSFVKGNLHVQGLWEKQKTIWFIP